MMMTTFRKSLLTATLLTAALTAGTAYAKEGRSDKDCKRYHAAKHEAGHRGKGMDRKAMLEREFSAEQIRTLTEARLIMKGDADHKVGKIDSNDKGYTIAIVNQKGELVEERQVAKNGVSIEKLERMQKRMQEREARKEAKKAD